MEFQNEEEENILEEQSHPVNTLNIPDIQQRQVNLSSQQRERENFYRNSTLIVDYANESFTGLLDYDLKKQKLTLLQFIKVKQHEIYHMCYNIKPCCMCPSGSTVPLFRHNNRILNPAQLDILLDSTTKLPGNNHKPNSQTKHCCCCANPNINYDQLDLSLTRCLLVNLTNAIPDRSPERIAVDELIRFRNESCAHATQGLISDYDYQIYKAMIEKSIMVLAKAQGRESEFKRKLEDAAVRPLDETILRQYQTTLMAYDKRYKQMIQTLRYIESAVGVKSLPEYLSKDLGDIKIVEGCDARLELWTKEGDVDVEWFKGETRIKDIEISDKYVVEILGQMHSLVVTNADLTDRGIYTAKLLGDTRSARLDIEEYYTMNMKKEIYCIEGDYVELSCAVLEDNVQAVWKKGGVIVQQSDKYKIKDTGKSHTLCISQPGLQDAGNYYVNVNHRIRMTSLQVREYFIKNLERNAQCIEGDKMDLSCQVIDDNATAEWAMNGVVLQKNVNYELRIDGKIHTLSILRAELQNAGVYSVRINNRLRSTTVYVKEFFTTNLERYVECIERDKVDLSCEVLDTCATAEWAKNDVVLQTNVNYEMRIDGKIHTLSILRAELQDAGVYSVKINNRLRSTTLIVKAIRQPIRPTSEKEKSHYLEIIKSATETRNFIRIVIIGENGVGKTCLLRRLLGEPIQDVTSTDGIDVVHRCKIRLSDGKLIIDKDTDKRKDRITRIKMALNAWPLDMSNIKHSKNSTDNSPNLLKDWQCQPTISKKGIETNVKLQSIQDKIGVAGLSTPNAVVEQGKIDQLPLSSLSADHLRRPIVEDKPSSKLNTVLTDTVLNELSQFINDIEKCEIPKEVMVDCGIWDFAGQRHYYPTHPVFLNPNAVHLLVADITKDIKQIHTEGGYDKIGEYIDFWFDSIHSCGALEATKVSTGHLLSPPVVLVCTGIDKCKDKLDERKNEFRKQLLSMMQNEEKRKHLRRICYVSNTEPSCKDFDHLRQSIVEFGKEIGSFGEQLPLKWIRLEQTLDIVRDSGVNILSWSDLIKLASICSIEDENEVKRFLKYHHKVGSIIYFESLKEHIILSQKWLADAFRCLVSDKYDDDAKLTPEWTTLEKTGELKPCLILKLFQKEREREFYKHGDHLLRVMEMFGVILKLTSLTEDGQRISLPAYYMPCMISEKTSIAQIYEVFGVNKSTCTRTPWLCIQFDFMPLDFFNHILFHYVRKYSVCDEAAPRRMALYHGMGVFFLYEFGKFVLCFSKNTVALQIWQWEKLKKGKCTEMLEELKSVINNVKNKYEPRSVSYSVKLKCGHGSVHAVDGRLSYTDLVYGKDEKYFCEEHNDSHDTGDFFQTWCEEYSKNDDYEPTLKEIKETEDQRFSQKCHICGKEIPVHWCHDCRISMCKDCNNTHRYSCDTLYHVVQHVDDRYTLDCYGTFNINDINGVKVLYDGLLVIADIFGRRLLTCYTTELQNPIVIPIPGLPFRIAIIDNTIVAVALYCAPEVLLVDVRKGEVVKKFDIKVMCKGITYRDRLLFLGCIDHTIKILNLSGEVTSTIRLGSCPDHIHCGDSGRFYYIDKDSLLCIDTEGKTLFTFTSPDMIEPRGITTDDGGYILVVCRRSNNVLRLSNDLTRSEVIITQMPNFDMGPHICYNSLLKFVIIGCSNTVYVYKKL